MPAHRILIADDDVDALRLVGLMLERKGYEITENNLENGACKFCGEKIPGVW